MEPFFCFTSQDFIFSSFIETSRNPSWLLVLEGVFVDQQEKARFIPVPFPSDEEVRQLVKTLSTRILRSLIRKGYLEVESLTYDPLAEANPLLASCLAASIRYRIALGERVGQSVRKLETLRECFYEEAERRVDELRSSARRRVTEERISNVKGDIRILGNS